MAAEDIFKLNSLGKLQGRSVRGAKPSTTNAKKSGRFYVTTDASSDAAPAREYLIQGAKSANTYTGSAIFVQGSPSVTGIGFGSLVPGDTIRKDGDTASYSISAVLSPTRLTLSAPYAQPTTSGTFTARKVLMGSAKADFIVGTAAAPTFSYDMRQGAWAEAPSATHSAPVATSTTDFLLTDGIHMHGISRNASPTPDIVSVNTMVDKVLKVEVDGMPFTAFPVVPFPADHSSVRVQRKRPEETSFKDITHASDYFLGYKQSPVYTMDQPPFPLRKHTMLYPSVGFQGGFAFSAEYQGVWAVSQGSERITAIVEGSETVEMGNMIEIEYITLTAQNITDKFVTLSALPSGKVSLNVNEATSQVEGTDFKVSGRKVSWGGLGMDVESLTEGITLRIAYGPIPGTYTTVDGNILTSTRRLKPYRDYLMDYQSGMLTTVNTDVGRVTTVQYIKFSEDQLAAKTAKLYGAPLGAVAVSAIHGSSLAQGVDYVVDGSYLKWEGLAGSVIGNGRKAAVRVVYEISTGEHPVQVTMAADDYFSTGLEAFKTKGTFDEVSMQDVRLLGTAMRQGVDYNCNEKNGTFRFEKDLLPEDTVAFQYYVSGNRISSELLQKLPGTTGSYRTGRYPILEGSVLAQGSTDGGTTPLEEDVHFSLSYKTGVLTLLPGVAFRNITIDYTPAAPLSCLVKKGENGMQIRMVGEPAAVAGDSINMFNPNLTADSGATDFAVTTRDGKAVPLANLSFAPTSRVLSYSATTLLAGVSVVRVSYTYAGTALPFAPLYRTSKTLESGKSSILTEGSDKAKNSFQPGRLLAVSPRTGGTNGYHLVTSLVDTQDGVNFEAKVTGAFTDTLKEPIIMASSKPVAFRRLTGFTAAPFRKGDTSVVLRGDATTLATVGRFLRVAGSGKDEIYRITSSSFVDSRTTLTFEPPAVSSEASPENLSSLLVSECVVYVEGDTAILTQYPILPEHPLWRISYLREDGSAEASVTGETLVFKESGPSGIVSYEVTIADYEFAEDLAAAVEALGGGTRFSVEWLYPQISDFRSSYILPDNFSQTLPKTVMVGTQVLLKKDGDTAHTPLKYGSAPGQGDFHITGGIVVLNKPIKLGSLYSVAYLGVDSHRSDIGLPLYVTAKHIAPQPEGTLYKVTCDYVKPDQFYIETMTEEAYYRAVVVPYMESLASRAEGAQTTGVEGHGSGGQTNSAGGMQDSYFSLREEAVKQGIYQKAHDYYLGRMGTMATEVSSTRGERMGNADPSKGQQDERFSLYGIRDAQHTALFGVSSAFPAGQEGQYPQPDPRFATKYTSYGRLSFYNVSGHGAAQGSDANFLSRGFVPGDKIRRKGTTAWCTISSIPSETNVVFSEVISGVPGAPSGSYGYEVLRASAPAYPVVDGFGCACATARSTAQEPFGIDPAKELLTVEHAENGGAPVAVDVTLATLTAPFSVERVASALNEALSPLLSVTVEDNYAAPGVDVASATSTSWPLAMPEKGGASGCLRSLCFRANSPSTSFTFRVSDGKTMAMTLGLSVDVTFSGNTDFNAVSVQALKEVPLRASEDALAVDMLASIDRIARSRPWYKDTFLASVSQAYDVAGVEEASLTEAQASCAALAVETDATAAIATTFAQSTAMLGTYGGMLTETRAMRTSDQVLLSKTTEASFGSHVNDSRVVTLQESSLTAGLTASLAAGTGPYIILDVSTLPSDPRVLYGDKSGTSTVYGAKVFPAYSASEQLQGTWDVSPSEPERTVLAITCDYSHRFSVSASQLYISYMQPSPVPLMPDDEIILTYSFAVYPTVGELCTAVQASPHLYCAVRYGTATSGVNVQAAAKAPSANLAHTVLSAFQPGATPDLIPYGVLQYSPYSLFRFRMGDAFTLWAQQQVSAVTYEVTGTALVFHASPRGPHTFTFASYQTLGALANAINVFGSSFFGASVAPAMQNYQYLKLAQVATRTVPKVEGDIVFLGVKGPVSFLAITNSVLDGVKASCEARGSSLNSYPGIMSTRANQVRASFAAEGLVQDKEYWYRLLANRVEGPCAKIVQVKRQLLGM